MWTVRKMRVWIVALRSVSTLFVGVLVTFCWMFIRVSELRTLYSVERAASPNCPAIPSDAIDHNINLKTNISREFFQPNCTAAAAEAGSITVLIWADRSLLHLSGKPRYMAFQPVLSADEYANMMDLFTIFLSVCEQHGLEYVMYGGSLLGVRRHAGIVPWDDDIDVLMNSSQRFLFRDVIELVDGLSIDAPVNHQWKIYKSGKCDFESDSCSNKTWPYIDIFFYDENTTHIWDNNAMYKATYCYKKTEIYPLQYGLFEGLRVRIPNQIDSALRKSYNPDLCVTSIFSHKYESYTDTKQMALPCKRLFPYFPFIFHECVNRVIVEYLKLRHYTIQAIKSKVKC